MRGACTTRSAPVLHKRQRADERKTGDRPAARVRSHDGGNITARTSDTTSDTSGKGHAKVKQGTPGGAGGKGQSGSDAGKTQSAKRDKSGYGSTGSKSSGGTGSSQGSGGGSGGTHG